MPELPEVETTRAALAPVLEGRLIAGLDLRETRLRWPVPSDLPARLTGQRVLGVRRRGRYLLIDIAGGSLIVHLGMSGSIRILGSPSTPPGPHDHIDLRLRSGVLLRYTDPRRFGAWLWAEGDPANHPLLAGIGPEPFAAEASDLFRQSRGLKSPIKTFIMDNSRITGVGNIYAAEALFRAGIHPLLPAGRLSAARWDRLLETIRVVLTEAIAAGGTTLRDFSSGRGRPGYFARELAVYGRGGHPCIRCGRPLREARLASRATVYCPNCQRR